MSEQGHRLVSHPRESGWGLCKRVEDLILRESVSPPDDPGVAPVFVRQSFAWLAGIPSDPFDVSGRGFKARVVAQAAKLNITIEEKE